MINKIKLKKKFILYKKKIKIIFFKSRRKVNGKKNLFFFINKNNI
jgi:hypothetical protein